jgi:hypothetical protein
MGHFRSMRSAMTSISDSASEASLGNAPGGAVEFGVLDSRVSAGNQVEE